jgi:hypothetical protein
VAVAEQRTDSACSSKALSGGFMTPLTGEEEVWVVCPMDDLTVLTRRADVVNRGLRACGRRRATWNGRVQGRHPADTAANEAMVGGGGRETAIAPELLSGLRVGGLSDGRLPGGLPWPPLPLAAMMQGACRGIDRFTASPAGSGTKGEVFTFCNSTNKHVNLCRDTRFPVLTALLRQEIVCV